MFTIKNPLQTSRACARSATRFVAPFAALALIAALTAPSQAQPQVANRAQSAKDYQAAKLAKLRSHKAPAGASSVSGPQAVAATNTFLAIDYNNGSGQFSIQTGTAHPKPNKNVFFPTGTSYITFRDATDKVMWVNESGAPSPGLAGYTTSSLTAQPHTTTPITNGFRTVYTLPKWEVVQDVVVNGTTLDNSNVLQQVTVKNTTNAPREFGLRYMWDWQIDQSDDSVFAKRSPDAPFTDQFTTFENPDFRLYEERDNLNSTNFSIFGSVRDLGLTPPPTAPDQLRYSSWSLSSSSAWDFNNTGSGTDSSVCYYWGFNTPISSAPNETKLFAEYVTTQASAISLPAVRFSNATYSVNENGGALNVTLERAGDTTAQVSVLLATTPGTATEGVDYTAVSQRVVFGPGDITKTVQIPITNDGDPENDETFTLVLSSPVGAIVGVPATATATIRDFTNVAPVVVSANPDNGVGAADSARSLKVVYSDANGARDIVQMRVLLNEKFEGKNALYAIYDRAANRLSLINDAGNAPVGSFAPGSPNILTNSQGSLNCAATTVIDNGNAVTIDWNFTPNGFFLGTKNIYAYASDKNGLSSDFVTHGTFTITNNTGNHPPLAQSVTPASGSANTSAARTLSMNYVDLDGANDITQARILVRDSYNGTNALYGLYDAVANRLYLFDDLGKTLLGGVVPGSNSLITNTQGTLNCKDTTVVRSGNILTVNWNFTPNGFFVGTKNIYGLARDTAGLTSQFEKKGVWNITANPGNDAPVNASLSPSLTSSAVGLARTLTANYADADGATDIAQARILINADQSGANALYGVYDRAANKLYLFNDAGNSLVGGFAPGSANVISNTQGTLNCAQTSVTVSGTKLTIAWNFTPKAAFAGEKKAFLLARDAAGAAAGFDQLATWRITNAARAGVQKAKPSANRS